MPILKLKTFTSHESSVGKFFSSGSWELLIKIKTIDSHWRQLSNKTSRVLNILPWSPELIHTHPEICTVFIFSRLHFTRYFAEIITQAFTSHKSRKLLPLPFRPSPQQNEAGVSLLWERGKFHFQLGDVVVFFCATLIFLAPYLLIHWKASQQPIKMVRIV